MKKYVVLIIVVFFAFVSCHKNQKQKEAGKQENIAENKTKNSDSIGNSPLKENEKSENEIHLEPLSEDALNKIYVDLKNGDSLLHLAANIRTDYRIFGYAKPDILSEKLVLISIFTNEVENNPFKCRFGSYYELNPYNQSFKIKYKSEKNSFVTTELTDSLNNKIPVYFEKKWIETER